MILTIVIPASEIFSILSLITQGRVLPPGHSLVSRKLSRPLSLVEHEGILQNLVVIIVASDSARAGSGAWARGS